MTSTLKRDKPMSRGTSALTSVNTAQLTIKEKKRKCKVCGTPFRTFSSFVSWCSPDCGAELALRKLEKVAESAAKKERAEIKSRREAIKTRSDWMKEAQIAFNAYVRERDKGRPCICCNQPLAGGDVGGAFDCGHYRSVGSAPHLRFDERNAHGQRKQCNRYGAGRAVDYRIGLIARIGLEAVEALESDQSTRKWTIEDLKTIKAHYKKKLRELQGMNKGGV